MMRCFLDRSFTTEGLKRLAAACLAVVLAAGLAAGSGRAQSITVLTHDSFSLPLDLVDAFTAETGIEVTFLTGGDAGEVVNRAILTKARPLADLLFGVDDNLLERARSEGIFEPYLSPALQRVPPELWLDDEGLVTPVDVGYVVPNLDLAWFAEHGAGGFSGAAAGEAADPAVDPAAGITLADLADARYAGLTVALNPASSSPGLAFMLTTIARFGDPSAGIAGAESYPVAGGGAGDWLDYWAALRDNGLSVTDGWTEAYYTAFSRYGGDRPIVVSYASSPAAEVIFAEEPLSEAPTANLQCEGCAYRQVEGIGILAGTDESAAAREFIDFLLSREAQEAIPLEMFVAPVAEDAAVPEEFARFAVLEPGVVATPLPSATVHANQGRWLTQWTAVVMQGRDPASVR